MNRTMRAALCGLVALVFAAGCSSTSNHSILTLQELDAAGLVRDPHEIKDLGPVEGQACRFFLLALIPFGDSSLGKAIEKAVLKVGGDAVINASVTSSLYGFVPIYNVLSFTCTTVKGVAVKLD
jgi:hypothetical protein